MVMEAREDISQVRVKVRVPDKEAGQGHLRDRDARERPDFTGP